ncbi:hypothetical protein BKP37_17855 [Anaerobacillus alkalilacustris]|uniref:Spore protein YkvP/CgeB glycosyl transferase-like domain-containing protein n=1 Tax=Anaerobacillus alkalilacustris TaxID=393763 RepID=A0A1S2LFY1_9BACI|nr:glycosyltransferase [Anaerobacillus alkalilacustris]OIJ10405.1 hypothetical protein BKP37_17855 [Anaerobacillus alkalilacustris]
MKFLNFTTKDNTVSHLSSLRNLKVLFVKSGGGRNGPFKDIDKYVIRTIDDLVKELYVVSPNGDIQYLVKKHQPDLILVLLGRYLSKEKVKSFTNLGVTTALWTGDDPYIIDIMSETARAFDYVFTNELNCVPYYQSIGCRNVSYLPLGVYEKVFEPKSGSIPKLYQSDICFVGNAFSSRIELFDEIVPYLSNKNTKIVGNFWRKMKNYSLIKGSVRHTWISPIEAATYYNGAKIVLNIHRSADDKKFNLNESNIEAASINPRTFEIAACQAFQLTDIRKDLTNFYIPEKEIEIFSTPNELIEKINYYLEHDQERKEIARNGYTKTYMKHRYHVRLIQLLMYVMENKV